MFLKFYISSQINQYFFKSYSYNKIIINKKNLKIIIILNNYYNLKKFEKMESFILTKVKPAIISILNSINLR